MSMPSLLFFIVTITAASGFNVAPSVRTFTQLSALDRRTFLDASFLVTSTAAVMALSPPAFADDDLTMPTEEEQQKVDMEEKLRKKAELQKKATRPKTFGESLMGEKEKQKSLEKTKQERRNAMCEELGRGC